MILSIIIPMFNVEQYLPKCIESVYNQDLDEAEFEIILIDDESPDNSLEVAKNLTLNKKNVKIISQNNKGLGGARNTGIENASGKYLVFLDSDDWFLPKTLQNVAELAIKNNLDILEFGAQGITQDNKIVYSKSITSDNTIYNGVDYYQKIRYMDSACNKLYNRFFLNSTKLRFLEKVYIEDYEFNTRAFLNAQRVMATSSIVSHFLQSPNSITRNVSDLKKEKMKKDVVEVIKKINQLKKGADTTKIAFLNQRLSYLTATLFYQLVKNKACYSEFVNLKKQLLKEDLFFINFPIFDKQKNFFRIVFLKNFFLFRLIAKM
jgi:glycosyltransferase involved in cell wall biosynthesis